MGSVNREICTVTEYEFMLQDISVRKPTVYLRKWGYKNIQVWLQEQSRVWAHKKHLKSRIQILTLFPYVLNMEGMRNRSNLPSSVTAKNTRVNANIFTMRFQNVTSEYRIKQFIVQCTRVTWLFCQLCECMCSHLQDSRTAAPSSLQGSLGPQTMFF